MRKGLGKNRKAQGLTEYIIVVVVPECYSETAA
jgi:hypothetical protein